MTFATLRQAKEMRESLSAPTAWAKKSQLMEIAGVSPSSEHHHLCHSFRFILSLPGVAHVAGERGGRGLMRQAPTGTHVHLCATSTTQRCNRIMVPTGLKILLSAMPQPPDGEH